MILGIRQPKLYLSRILQFKGDSIYKHNFSFCVKSNSRERKWQWYRGQRAPTKTYFWKSTRLLASEEIRNQPKTRSNQPTLSLTARPHPTLTGIEFTVANAAVYTHTHICNSQYHGGGGIGEDGRPHPKFFPSTFTIDG